MLIFCRKVGMLDELVGWREEKVSERSGLHFANSFSLSAKKKKKRRGSFHACPVDPVNSMKHQHSLSKSVISSWLSILAVPLRPQLQRISRVIYTLNSSYLDTTLLHILLKRYSHLSLSLPPLLHDPPFPFAFCFWLQHVHFVWPLWCSEMGFYWFCCGVKVDFVCFECCSKVLTFCVWLKV